MTDKKIEDTDEETVIVDERKVTWSYSRKRNLGNYESEDVGIYLTDHVPKSTKNIVKWVSDKSEAVFNELKVQVWTAHGLDFGFNDRGDPILDKPTPVPAQSLGPPVVSSSMGGPPPPIPTVTLPVQEQRAPGQSPSIAQVGMHAVTPTFCRDCGAQGLEAFWDNRVQNDENQAEGKKIGPDFKCKTCEGGNGPNKQNKPTPIYRPGSYDYNQRVGNAASEVSTVPPGTIDPPESSDPAPF